MKKLLLIASLALSWMFFSAKPVSAVTETVCASGCTYTSLIQAGTSAATGTTIQVLSTYSAASETFPIQLRNASTTIECAAGATIGQTSVTGDNTFQLTTSSTVRGCTFSNINLYTGTDVYTPGIFIENNTFTPAVTGTISLNSQLANTFIRNNTNIDNILLYTTNTNVTISQNVFYGNDKANVSGLLLTTSATSSNLTVSENYFYSYFASTTTGSNLKLISIITDGMTFTTNTVRYMVTPPAAMAYTMIIGSEGGTHDIYGNKIEAPARGAGDTDPCVALAVHPAYNRAQTLITRIQNNTFRNRCGGGSAISLSDGGYSSITIYASSTKNLFYGDVPSTFKPAMEFSRQAASSLLGTVSQNGLYGYSRLIENQAQANVTAVTTYEMNPFVQLGDVDTANDLDVAPFSIYLNIDGAGGKIGASTGTRRTTIYVDDTGTVDYSAVDMTSLASVSSTMRSGDTVSIAAGTYTPLELNSSYATTSLTFTGAGESTIINASTNQNALSFTSVTSSSISGMVLQNASTTSDAYTSTRMNFVYGGNSYADESGDLGISANTTNYVLDGDLNILAVSADDTSVSSVTGIGTDAFHIALVNRAGSRVTFLIPNSVFANQAAFEAVTSGYFTTDVFVQNAFTVSGGVYTYASAAVASAEVTLLGGLTTPAISSALTGYAGLKLVSSGGITINNVTSTNNAYGIWFASGTGNRIYDSALSSSSLYDIRQDASATNTVDNVTFNRTSSTVTGVGPILVKFQARASVYRAANSGTKISGSTVTVTDASSVGTALGATNGSGLTSYVRLPAYTITSGSNAVTNGGFNSYTVTAGSVTGYSASSATITLSSRDQELTVGMFSDSAPTAPTSPTLSAGSTSATFWWVDNSDDETSFTMGYATSSDVSAFPGTTSSTSAATTTFSNLFPNYPYIFRVAAIGPGGTSSYATSTAIRTLAATPGAPTVTASGRTTATIALDANGNSSATKFLVYNSTLGSYVTSTGASVGSPDWQTTSTWAAVTMSGLTCGTAYSFVTVARNEDLVVTATSSAGTVTTSACESSGGSSSGGGGAASSAGGGFFTPSVIPPVTIPVPTPVEPLPVPVVIWEPEKVVDPVVETRIEAVLAKDYKEFKTQLPPATQDLLTKFMAFGEGPKTEGWGEGERRALVRDALDTLGDKINLVDMERIAEGELPLTRNLTRERVQLTRIRQTFRTIYKRDPNFKNQQENMVWNAMMYRLRFERDLTIERQGVGEFKALFRRTPTDPFQWAVVRALGYVLR